MHAYLQIQAFNGQVHTVGPLLVMFVTTLCISEANQMQLNVE